MSIENKKKAFIEWFQRKYKVTVEFDGDSVIVPMLNGRRQGRSVPLVTNVAWAAVQEFTADIDQCLAECAEPGALNDPTLTHIGQIATGIRDLRADTNPDRSAYGELDRLFGEVRRWGVEHTGCEPSLSCFHRAIDRLHAFIKSAPQIGEPVDLIPSHIGNELHNIAILVQARHCEDLAEEIEKLVIRLWAYRPGQVRFMAACSGLWYEDPHACGAVSKVRIGDTIFTLPSAEEVQS